jgi:hypothetical protein
MIIGPALVSYWRGTERMQAAARVGGQEPLNAQQAVARQGTRPDSGTGTEPPRS